MMELITFEILLAGINTLFFAYNMFFYFKIKKASKTIIKNSNEIKKYLSEDIDKKIHETISRYMELNNR